MFLLNSTMTLPLLSRVRYQKTNQIEHDIIHDRTRFRGSEYLVWFVIIQWIGSPSIDKSASLFVFLITYFRRYLERSSDVLVIAVKIPHGICHVNGDVALHNQNIKCHIYVIYIYHIYVIYMSYIYIMYASYMHLSGTGLEGRE